MAKIKVYNQYDYDNDTPYSEARIEVPFVNDCFLLEPLSYSTPQVTFSGYGADDKAATEKLIEKLEKNAKALQATADRLKAEKLADSDKRQPIKEQTLDEFNNARQVAYGNNVQVEPLTEK